MYLDKAKKEEIFGQYGKSATDTGSAEAQIALFSYRISHLTEHLKKNHKDHNTARSLTMLVGKRRKLLKYLYNKDINRYRREAGTDHSAEYPQHSCADLCYCDVLHRCVDGGTSGGKGLCSYRFGRID